MMCRTSSTTEPLSNRLLQQAIRALVNKHVVLRTKLFINATDVILQSVCDVDEACVPSTIVNLNEDERNNLSQVIQSSNLFDINKGQVLHCHIIHQS